MSYPSRDDWAIRNSEVSGGEHDQASMVFDGMDVNVNMRVVIAVMPRSSQRFASASLDFH
jgi:hypothetical protein